MSNAKILDSRIKDLAERIKGGIDQLVSEAVTEEDKNQLLSSLLQAAINLHDRHHGSICGFTCEEELQKNYLTGLHEATDHWCGEPSIDQFLGY